MTARWLAPEDATAEALAHRLARKLGAEAASPAPVDRRFLDTFDGLLHATGEILVADRLDEAVRVRLVSEADGRATLGSVVVDETPTWPHDLPPNRLAARLAEVCAPRALQSKVRVTGQAIHLEMRDERDKVVCRLAVQDLAARRGRKKVPLGLSVGLRPVRGYDDAAALAAKALRKAGLTPSEGGAYERALAAVELPASGMPGAPPSVDPAQRADVAVRAVLRHQVAVLRATRKGLEADVDSEFLHDFRVAVRRTRAILGQVKRVFPEASTARWAEAFKWLGAITGPTRDLDVYLLSWPALRDGVAPEVRPDLAPFHAYLVLRQREEHAALVAHLRSPRYRKLLQGWDRFLRTRPAEQPTAEHALRPIGRVLAKRVRKLHARVLAEGRVIHADTPADPIHDLRKTCKKLRYALELFPGVLPADPVARAVKHLKKLQRVLGTFNDQEVQANALRTFADDMMARDVAPAPTLLAMGKLVDDLRAGQAETRAAFDAAWSRFDTAKVAARFEEVTA